MSTGGGTFETGWKTLAEICDVRDGTHDSPKAVENGKYLITSKNVRDGKIDYTGAYFISEEDYNKINQRSKVDTWDVLFTMIGTVGEVGLVSEQPDFAIKNVGLIKTGDRLLAHFLKHYLVSDTVKQYVAANKSKGTQAFLALGKLRELPIPVMQRQVMERLVNVLDNFDAICSDLNIGLPAEIEARKKQYEYYRDMLLTFAAADDIILTDRQTDRQSIIKLLQYVFGYVKVSLEDISENCDNQRKPVTSGNRESGEYPYYGASGIVDYVNDYIFDGDYLLVSEDGANLLARNTPIAFSISGKNWVNNHAHILKFKTYETRKFVEYYLNSIDLTTFISGGAQPKLNQKNLNKIPIPIPSQEKQKDIVAILDRFDTLCNDLTTGLPAEIEARQKQYEYYRDKLLAFKELDNCE